MYHIVPEFDSVFILQCTGFCHGVVRLVSSNGCALGLPRCREVGLTQRLYILFPRCREVGFIQRSYIISTTVRSGLPDGSSSCIIIIIITTTSFDVEGREVGVPRFMMVIWYGTSLVYGMVVYGMVHRWYMVWYIVGI